MKKKEERVRIILSFLPREANFYHVTVQFGSDYVRFLLRS